jgi:hypothetical protein
MAKKIKERVDVNDIFYDGVHDDASKAEVMKSALWPVLVAMYSFSDKQLRIGPDGATCTMVHFLTVSGTPAAAVRLDADGDMSVMSADRGIHGKDDAHISPYTDRIVSKNPRYIVNTLKAGSSHEGLDCIRNSIKNSQNIFSEVLFKSLDQIVDVLAECGVTRPRVGDLSHAETDTLLNIALGNKSKSEADPHILGRVEHKYETYTKQMAEFVKRVDRAADMFHSDKWVVAKSVLGGVIVGAVSSKPLLTAYEMYKRDGHFPHYISHRYDEAIVPFKWYKSLDALPEDIKSDFTASAVMFKAHFNSNSQELLPTLGRTDNGTVVWESIEAHGFNSWMTDGTDIIVFNK